MAEAGPFKSITIGGPPNVQPPSPGAPEPDQEIDLTRLVNAIQQIPKVISDLTQVLDRVLPIGTVVLPGSAGSPSTKVLTFVGNDGVTYQIALNSVP